MEIKVCTKCNEEKELGEFYSQKKEKANGEEYFYILPECKECTKKRTTKWEKDNYERVKENRKKIDSERKKYFREYRMKHKDQRYRILKDWQQNNPDKVKVHNEKRQNNKKHSITNKEWEDCKKYFVHRCAYCGLAIEEHYILYKGNTQLGDFHKEHVDDEGANDLSNCIPACKSCNTSKHNREFNEWYNESNPVFTYERLEKIHKWLNEDYKNFIKNN